MRPTVKFADIKPNDIHNMMFFTLVEDGHKFLENPRPFWFATGMEDVELFPVTLNIPEVPPYPPMSIEDQVALQGRMSMCDVDPDLCPTCTKRERNGYCTEYDVNHSMATSCAAYEERK